MGSRSEDYMLADEFPAGIRVLVVDDDPYYLLELEKMLQSSLYEVTICNRAKKALSILEGHKNEFDLVLSDLHMPEMDGFQLLEMMVLMNIDVPVVIMSKDDKKEDVKKSIVKGACEYLVKPLRKETIQQIWRHVLVKKQKEFKQSEKSEKSNESAVNNAAECSLADSVSIQNEANLVSKRKKNGEDDSEAYDDVTTSKKPRIIWTVELHQKFIRAVNQLGRDKAVPKKILECMKEMNVTGLTRENVASHLQKYRLYLQRHTESFPETGNFQPYMEFKRSIFQQSSATTDATAGQFAVPPGLTTTTTIPFPAAGGIPFVDQRNLFRIAPQSSFYHLTDCSTSGAAMVPYNNNLCPPTEENEHAYLVNTDDQQHNRSLSITNYACEMKSEYAFDQYIPDNLLYLKYFGQDETFRGGPHM